MSVRVLVLEDEASIREFIVINLKNAGFEVIPVDSGEEALEILEKENIDIAVLDVMLPGIDGFEVCKRVRKDNKYIGIIMLTAKAQEEDKIEGLLNGADDYVIKPFSPRELVARVESLQRRVTMLKVDASEKFVDGPFEIDFQNRQIFKNDEEIDLTQLEFAVVALLAKNAGKPLSREEILEEVWGSNFFGSYKIVDVNMRRIRQKLEKEPSDPEYVLTIWGLGYKWKKGE